ncbi:MAG TPA: hypothetical protein VHM88_08115 [Candidatus Acidoferrales bacterium]|jgi:hypothetical protein|nr:hypothetical protein [Candidatus Acidoferrales bacterium]
MVAIHSLKPYVSLAEAIKVFRARGIAGVLGRFRTGPLRSVADVYVPFHLYQVQISIGGRSRTRWLALDAVTGTLDPYEFERPPAFSELVAIKTRNCLRLALEEAQARDLLCAKLRHLIFQTGFFRLRNLQIHPQPLPLELHVPYWIGFYGAGESARLRVLDALRGCFEGGKARAFFEAWLTSAR